MQTESTHLRNTKKMTFSINKRIKVFRRMAYGFRDDQYFLSKIRASSPEFGDEPILLGGLSARSDCCANSW